MPGALLYIPRYERPNRQNRMSQNSRLPRTKKNSAKKRRPPEQSMRNKCRRRQNASVPSLRQKQSDNAEGQKFQNKDTEREQYKHFALSLKQCAGLWRQFIKGPNRQRGSATDTVCERNCPAAGKRNGDCLCQRQPAAGKYDGAVCERSMGNRKQELCEGQGFPFQAPFLADSISRIPSTELKTALAS